MSQRNNESPRTRTRGRSIIRGGSGKILSDSDKQAEAKVYSGEITITFHRRKTKQENFLRKLLNLYKGKTRD
jgi:hypothetical protein